MCNKTDHGILLTLLHIKAIFHIYVPMELYKLWIITYQHGNTKNNNGN